MGDADGRVGRVDALPAVSASAEDVDAELFLGDVDVVVLVDFGKDQDRRGGGVDAPLRLRGGDALHAVGAALEAQGPVDALAGDGGDDLLVAARFTGVVVHHGDLPAARLAVAAVHAEEIAGKEGRLVAARAGADFEKRVALVGRVGGEKGEKNRLLGGGDLLLEGGNLLLGHFAELGVGGGVVDQRLVVGQLGERRGIGLDVGFEPL